MTKKMVWEETYAPRLEMSDIKGSPDDIAKLFRDEQLIVADQFGIADPTTIEFEAQQYGYDGGIEMYARWPRLETEKEYEARLKKEEADKLKAEKKAAAARKRKETLLRKAMEEKAVTEAAERAMLAELKAKYGE